MKRSRLVLGLAALTITAVLGLLLAQPHRPVYAALGDSYAAGNGTTGSTGACRRSSHAYGPLLARQWHAEFTHAACSGATTRDVENTQLTTLTRATDLVTLTVGGNDGDVFVTLIAACALNPTPAPCALVTTQTKKYLTTALPRKLQELYRAMARRLDATASVLVSGYPRVYGVQAPRSRCGVLPPPAHNRMRMNEVADALNAAIRQAVHWADATFPQKWLYVPIDFGNHTLCSVRPWLLDAGKAVQDIKAPWHPTDAGHMQYARQFATLYRSVTHR